MGELIFIATVIFVAYVFFVVLKEPKDAPAANKPQEGKTEAIKSETVAAEPAVPAAAPIPVEAKEMPAVKPVKTAVKPVRAKAGAKTAVAKVAPAPVAEPVASVVTPAPVTSVDSLKNPKTGEVAKIPNSYAFAKRWIKDALVEEGLLDKVYKNNELDEATSAKIQAALQQLKGMAKYQ